MPPAGRRHAARVTTPQDDAGPDDASAGRDLPWLAGVLDEASRERSRYLMAMLGRERLGLPPVDELPDDVPAAERAVAWALAYHVETVDGQGRRRVRLAPEHEHDDGSDPPAPRDVPEEVADAWRTLAGLVSGAPARARLRHLLFERGGPGAWDEARAAASAYLQSAQDWDRGLDAVVDLSAATRLARAVRDGDLARQAADAMTALAERHLAAPEPLGGVVLRHLVGEPDCPDAVTGLLDRAAQTLPSVQNRDAALALVLQRCAADTARAAVWRRRVEGYTAEADAAPSKIMRAVRLQQALALAEASGDATLRQQAAAALQTVRHDDLGLTSFTATSRRYEEEFERQVQQFCPGGTWKDALYRYGTFPPPSGDTARNRDIVAQRHREHPLAALFPPSSWARTGCPSTPARPNRTGSTST